MKPYYEDSWCKIFNCDCREILDDLPKVDLILTDPPYGINLETAYRLRGRGRLAQCNNYSKIYGDDKEFDPSFLLRYKAVIFGANYFCSKLPKSSGWLVWDKRCGRMQNDQADGELAWTNFIKGVRIFHYEWNGFIRDGEKGQSFHPTQKPVALMQWVLGFKWTPAGNVVDPYMGSGTTLRAAKDLNRKSIGIEISEKYCEIAAERLSQEVLDLTIKES